MNGEIVKCECGREPRLIVEIADSMYRGPEVIYFVKCPGCGRHANNYCKTPAEAWQKWLELCK